MRRLIPTTLSLILLLTAAPAHAGLRDDLTAVDGRIEQLKAQTGSVRSERTDLANEVIDLGDRLAGLAADLDAAQQRLDDVDADIAATEQAVVELNARIGASEAAMAQIRRRVEASRADALDRAVQLYMAMGASDVAALPVAEQQDAAVGSVYADRIERRIRDDIDTYEALRVQEQREVAAYEQQRDDVTAAAARLEDARADRKREADDVAAKAATLQSRLTEQEALLDELDATIAEMEGELASLEAEQSRIQELIRQEQQPGGTAPGILVRPVPGAVSSGFGYRIHPIYGDRRLHTGWDMNASCGEPIVAAASGRVFLADWKGGYGLAVMIDHGGGMATLYGHQSQLAVSYGQQVEAGQVIGYVGTTGTSTACHLHFEVRINGTPVDPGPYL